MGYRQPCGAPGQPQGEALNWRHYARTKAEPLKMSIEHDPLREAAYLKQCLSEDKRPIGFLLAAGCPQSIKDEKGQPLIPAIDALTAGIGLEIAKTDKVDAYGKVVANLKADGIAKPNLEKILTHIRGLLEVAGRGDVRGLDSATLRKLDEAVCDKIVEAVKRELPKEGTAYRRLASWIQARERKDPVEIFTPNYDLLFEQALEEHSVPYFDGFVGSRKAFFDTRAMEDDRLPARWARLWKLHGSINWWRTEGTDGGIAYRGERIGAADRHMIHPSHLKYDESRRMPYLAMIDRLRSFLRKPSSVLVCCGYSFGDEHLNACLDEGLRGNALGALFALSYGELETYPDAIKLAGRLGNFSLFAEDKAVIGTRTGIWMGREESAIQPGGSVAVVWKGGGTKSHKSAKFTLGDFEAFGGFLAELMGDAHLTTETDAK